MSLSAEAFAKINLSLRVLGRRPDGYHSIETLFQSIDLADGISVDAGEGTIAIECDDSSIPVDSRNLVSVAGVLLAKRFGVVPSARIEIRKKSPAGGGLGGGSSDAAAALVLLARLWDVDGSAEALSETAAEVGSDVAYFLTGGRAKATGRGERIEPLADEPETDVLLVEPPFGVSTAAVYAALADNPPAGDSVNDLSNAALAVEPRLRPYRDALRRRFPAGEISGSGSTLYALSPELAEVDRLARELPDARVRVVRTVGRAEYRRRGAVPRREEEK